MTMTGALEQALTSVFLLLATAVIGLRHRKAFVATPARFLAASIASLLIAATFTVLWGLEQAPAALAFGIGLTASVLDPVAAISFFVANAILRPWEVTQHPGMLFIPKFLGILCIGSWLLHGLKNGLRIEWGWPTRLLAGFAAWLLLSILASGDIATGFEVYRSTFLIAAILFVLLANVPRDQLGVDTLRSTLVISVVGAIAVATLSTLLQPGFSPSTHRLKGFGLTGNANDLAALAVLALPLAVARGLSISSLSGVGILLAGLALSQSRGALLAVGLAGATWYATRMREPGKAILAGAVIVPLLVIASSLMSLGRESDDLQQSSASRFNYAIAGLKMALRNPILGVGFDNYPRTYEQYSSGNTYEWGERTAHSSWVLPMAEAGFPALLLFAGLYALVLRRAWLIRRRHPAFCAAMAGYGLAMTFLSHTYTFFPYLLFGLVLSAERIERISLER